MNQNQNQNNQNQNNQQNSNKYNENFFFLTKKNEESKQIDFEDNLNSLSKKKSKSEKNTEKINGIKKKKKSNKKKKVSQKKNYDNISTKSLDSVDLDQEIIKLEKQLEQKTLSNTIHSNQTTKSDIDYIDENNSQDLNISNNVKVNKSILLSDYSDKIGEDSKKNNIIDDTKKALVKLLVDAKKNNGTLNSENNSDFKNKSTESNNKKIDMIYSDNNDSDMTISFNLKHQNIYLDDDEKNNIIIRQIDKQNKFKSNEINKHISDIIDSKNTNETNKVKHTNKLDKLKNKNSYNYGNISIISNEITEKECYNDYMIKLSEPIKLKDLNINNIQLPKRNTENISENNNRLEIEILSNNKIIELESNYYNRNEIITFLNECFEVYSLDIKIYMDDLTDRFVFESNKNEKFKLISSENSILPYLGFGKNTYFNKSKYIAENPLDVGDNIFYLVLENISNEPMFKIDMDSIEPIIEKLIELDEDIQIDHLIIKFYKTKNSIIKNNNEYSFFFESEHKINFEFL